MDTAAEEWLRWWEALIADETKAVSERPLRREIMPQASEFPTLARIASALGIEAEAISYSQARKREAAELRKRREISDAVQKILTDARPNPFRRSREVSLLVSQLPVEGAYASQRDGHHLLVSIQTCTDPEAYDKVLRHALGWSR